MSLSYFIDRIKAEIKWILLFFLPLTLIIGFFLGRGTDNKKPLSIPIIPERRTLDVYTIENLSKTNFPKETVTIGETLFEDDDYDDHYTSNFFTWEFTPNPKSNERRKVTGQINTPRGIDGPFPLVLMIRGYVDPSIYQTGVGTKRAAEVFAKNGYITIAPDFLGYGGSSTQADNVLEARFQSYTTALSLLASIENIPNWDGQNIFLWAHSNGGQVAQVLLETSGKKIPTTLWAPVTKPFPYSVLYYTDESVDKGKYIRKELANFERLYDTDLYSPDGYLDKLTGFPIQIHQGTADDAVPREWSDAFAGKLKKLEGNEENVTYFVYPGADHNLRPSWDTVVTRDLAFFAKNLYNTEP